MQQKNMTIALTSLPSNLFNLILGETLNLKSINYMNFGLCWTGHYSSIFIVIFIGNVPMHSNLYGSLLVHFTQCEHSIHCVHHPLRAFLTQPSFFISVYPDSLHYFGVSSATRVTHHIG